MKRQAFVGFLLMSLSCCAPILVAQESAVAEAERKQAEERYQRMSADIEDLQKTVQTYQQRLNEQREEIRRLNEEIARLGTHKDVATRDDFKQLADKIREVDERRIAGDKELLEKVTAEIKRLAQIVGDSSRIPAPPANPPKTPKGTPPPEDSGKPTKPGVDKGYEYTIRANDNPRVIAQALGKQGVKITAQQIIDANPKIADWTKLRIGQKIFIPAQAPL